MARPTRRHTTSHSGGGSSPLLPILIAVAVLAALSIGAVVLRQRRQVSVDEIFQRPHQRYGASNRAPIPAKPRISPLCTETLKALAGLRDQDRGDPTTKERRSANERFSPSRPTDRHPAYAALALVLQTPTIPLTLRRNAAPCHRHRRRSSARPSFSLLSVLALLAVACLPALAQAECTTRAGPVRKRKPKAVMPRQEKSVQAKAAKRTEADASRSPAQRRNATAEEGTPKKAKKTEGGRPQRRRQQQGGGGENDLSPGSNSRQRRRQRG